jgi:hypothetical protein
MVPFFGVVGGEGDSVTCVVWLSMGATLPQATKTLIGNVTRASD